MKTFLENRVMFVTINSSKSTFKNASADVAQGSVLSPILPSLFTRDIHHHSNTKLALYAHDNDFYHQKTYFFQKKDVTSPRKTS